MTGTPSRTATASGGGATRHPDGATRRNCAVPSPRGGVGRKLEAKLWPEEHEPHRGGRLGGRRRSVARSPMSSGPAAVDAAGGWSEGHAPYPGRSACLPLEQEHEQRLRASRRNRPGCRRVHAPLARAKKRATCSGPEAREAGRSTTGRQKSAEAKVAAAHGGERAEREAPNWREAFDA
jgi:hypothetical protein